MTLVILGAVVGFVSAWLIRGWDVYVWETRTKQLEADWRERLGFPHWLPREHWDEAERQGEKGSR